MKTKIVLEYPFKSTSGSLFRAVSSSTGLKSWFADDVVVVGDRYDFSWDKSVQSAVLINIKPNVSVRYRWDDEDQEECYFEFKVSHQELTGDILLTVTDFAEDDEMDDCRNLWNVEIDKLKRAIGCPKK